MPSAYRSGQLVLVPDDPVAVAIITQGDVRRHGINVRRAAEDGLTEIVDISAATFTFRAKAEFRWGTVSGNRIELARAGDRPRDDFVDLAIEKENPAAGRAELLIPADLYSAAIDDSLAEQPVAIVRVQYGDLTEDNVQSEVVMIAIDRGIQSLEAEEAARQAEGG